MIGKEDNQEEPVLKIEDKRMFNPDGSLREGITIEKEEKKPENPVEIPEVKQEPKIEFEGVVDTVDAEPPAATEKSAAEPVEDLMDDDDPASFINFLSTLVTNAAAALGAMPHPVTGQKSVDLDTGKYWIDVLTMLREKTKGNLAAQEEKLLTSILGDLQMQYVALTKATEEKLKAQAAKNFSSKDILGG